MNSSTSLQALLVEDNFELAEILVEHFELEGIQCNHVSNGVAALELVANSYHDVIILDINLPRMSGLEVCKSIRESGSEVPIIMMTARDSLQDKLNGFDSGADDYLTKPFAFEELIARVKVLSRRRSGEVSIFKVKDLELNIKRRTALRAGQEIKLSPTGYKILEILIRETPNPISRESLIQKVWGDEQPDSNSLKVHMFKLRKAIDDLHEDKLLHTIKNFGFVLR
ncbi:two-component system response regulator [Vibrio ponticus]|uniref:Two-component system response regulator n=1 Tax=Vibrio ponticus TaxID=265668 RepID=A0ABX3FNW5_9VIBR|nr:response regulator transcription factor [Vibrio ponticus]OLQ94438.1 two-component system response regulator [Vibrio ponticus]